MALPDKSPNLDIERLSDEPLSPQELKEIRYILQTEKHMKWFWATIRRWAMWTALTVAGIVTFRENIKALFNWFVR